MLIKAQTRLNIFVLATALGSLPVDAAVKTIAPSKTDLATITTGMVDSNAEVEATIKSIVPPREGSRAPYRFELMDNTGTITLIIWPDMYETVKTKSPLSTGDVVHVSAKVSTYRDNLQLQIQDASDLRIVPKPEPEKPPTETPSQPAAPGGNTITPLAGINAALIGKDVIVLAAVTEIREPRSERAPYTVTLTQDKASVPLVIWRDMYPQFKDKLKTGAQVRVNGQVTEYRGALQLKVKSAADVTVVNAP